MHTASHIIRATVGAHAAKKHEKISVPTRTLLGLFWRRRSVARALSGGMFFLDEFMNRRQLLWTQKKNFIRTRHFSKKWNRLFIRVRGRELNKWGAKTLHLYMKCLHFEHFLCEISARNAHLRSFAHEMWWFRPKVALSGPHSVQIRKKRGKKNPCPPKRCWDFFDVADRSLGCSQAGCFF